MENFLDFISGFFKVVFKIILVIIAVAIILFLAGVIFNILDRIENGEMIYDIQCPNYVEMYYTDQLQNILEEQETFFIVGKTKVFKKTTTIQITDDMISYDRQKCGEQTATITYLDNTKTFTLNIKQSILPTPSIKTTANGTVAWDDNDCSLWYQAEFMYFEVKINDTVFYTNEENFNLKTIPKEDFPQSDSDHVEVCVRAVSGDERFLNSEYSNVLEFAKPQPVTNIRYNNGYFMWDYPQSANFEIKINGTRYTTTERRLFITRLQATNSVTVQVLDNIPICSSVLVEKVFTKLASPTNISYASSYIEWNNPNHNGMFQLKINDNKYTLDDCHLDFDFEKNKTYTIQITVLGWAEDVINSDIKIYKITILDEQLSTPIVTVTPLNYKNEYLVDVGSVENADQYVVVIEFVKSGNVETSRTINLDGDQQQTTFTLPKGYTYKISVVAKDSSGEFENSNEYVLQGS